MVQLTRMPNDFIVTKMRDSFMKNFVEQGGNDLFEKLLEDIEEMDELEVRHPRKSSGLHLLSSPKIKSSFPVPVHRKVNVAMIVRKSNQHRILNDESTPNFPGHKMSLISKQHQIRMERK